MRHARARRFGTRLRAGVRGNATSVVLDLRDDGIGLDATRDAQHRGEGLQGMRDRVLALDGVLRIDSSSAGTRLHVLLRQVI